MPLPRWLARFNLLVTNRILGPVVEHAPGMGIVIHEGRKTRRQYRTPVMVFRHDERFVIALTYGRESQPSLTANDQQPTTAFLTAAQTRTANSPPR